MKKRIYIIGATILFMMGANSCSNSFYDVNNNPNSAIDVPSDLILPAALVSTSTYVNTRFQFLNLWMGYWNWSGNYSISTSDKNYQFQTSYHNDVWTAMYAGQLNNYQTIDTKAAAANQPFVQGMAKIMKAFCTQYLVDTYNNVPYSDALKGTTSITPKYDDAKTIYEDLIVQLDAGLALLKTAQGLLDKGATYNPGSNDIMFKGYVKLWQKFANTVKLRIAFRKSEKSGRDA